MDELLGHIKLLSGASVDVYTKKVEYGKLKKKLMEGVDEVPEELVSMLVNHADNEVEDVDLRTSAIQCLKEVVSCDLSKMGMSRVQKCVVKALREATQQKDDLGNNPLKTFFKFGVHIVGQLTDTMRVTEQERMQLMETVTSMWRKTGDKGGSVSIRKESAVCLLRMHASERARALMMGQWKMGWLQCVALEVAAKKDQDREDERHVELLRKLLARGLCVTEEMASEFEKEALGRIDLASCPWAMISCELCCLACGPHMMTLLSKDGSPCFQLLHDGLSKDAHRSMAWRVWGMAMRQACGEHPPQQKEIQRMMVVFKANNLMGRLESYQSALLCLHGFLEHYRNRYGSLTASLFHEVSNIFAELVRRLAEIPDHASLMTVACDVWSKLMAPLVEEATGHLPLILFAEHLDRYFLCFAFMCGMRTYARKIASAEERISLDEELRTYARGFIQSVRSFLKDPQIDSEVKRSFVRLWVDSKSDVPPNNKEGSTNTSQMAQNSLLSAGFSYVRKLVRDDSATALFDRTVLYHSLCELALVPTFDVLLEPEVLHAMELVAAPPSSVTTGGNVISSNNNALSWHAQIILHTWRCRRTTAQDNLEGAITDTVGLLWDRLIVQEGGFSHLRTFCDKMIKDSSYVNSVGAAIYRIRTWTVLARCVTQAGGTQNHVDTCEHLLAAGVHVLFSSIGASTSASKQIFEFLQGPPAEAWKDAADSFRVAWVELVNCISNPSSLISSLIAIVEDAWKGMAVNLPFVLKTDIYKPFMKILCEFLCEHMCVAIVGRVAGASASSTQARSLNDSIALNAPVESSVYRASNLIAVTSDLHHFVGVSYPDCAPYAAPLIDSTATFLSKLENADEIELALLGLGPFLELRMPESHAALLKSVFEMIRRLQKPTKGVVDVVLPWMKLCLLSPRRAVKQYAMSCWKEFFVVAGSSVPWSEDWKLLMRDVRDLDGELFAVPEGVSLPPSVSSVSETSTKRLRGAQQEEEEEEAVAGGIGGGGVLSISSFSQPAVDVMLVRTQEEEVIVPTQPLMSVSTPQKVTSSDAKKRLRDDDDGDIGGGEGWGDLAEALEGEVGMREVVKKMSESSRRAMAIELMRGMSDESLAHVLLKVMRK